MFGRVVVGVVEVRLVARGFDKPLRRLPDTSSSVQQPKKARAHTWLVIPVQQLLATGGCDVIAVRGAQHGHSMAIRCSGASSSAISIDSTNAILSIVSTEIDLSPRSTWEI